MLPFELTKDTPYLALSGELWSVFYDYFNRNWSCYKGSLLYSLVEQVNMGPGNAIMAFYWTSIKPYFHKAVPHVSKNMYRAGGY